VAEQPVEEGRVTEIGGWERIDRRGHPFAAALGVFGLLAVFVVGLVGLGVAVRDGDRRVEVARVLVPSVVGASEDAARETMEEVGLIVEVREAPNELLEHGIVFEQVPIPGARLEVGSAVTIDVSTGPAGAIVPDVVGQQATEAQQLLAAAGLTVGVVDEPDESVRVGEVLGTEPVAGRRAPSDGVVQMRVSSGPAPRTVPVVESRDILDVLAELGRLRLVPGDITRSDDSGEPDGTVLSITPASGTEVARDSEVALVVAGPRSPVPMPSVLGLLRSTAIEALADSGLEATFRVVALPMGDPRDGRVVRQGVAAAEKVPRGTVVEILIGSAPSPPVTTTTTTPTTSTVVPGSSTTVP
jgi:serine/threonine-protein kinase